MQIDTNGIEIGDKVRDTITDFEGVVIGVTQWTTGCARLTVQPPMTAKGKEDGVKLPDSFFSFDALTLEIIRWGPRHDATPDPKSIGAGKGGPPTLSIRDR